MNKENILYVIIGATGNTWAVVYKGKNENGRTVSGRLSGYGKLPGKYKNEIIVDFTTAEKFDFSFGVAEEYCEEVNARYIPLSEALKRWRNNGATILNQPN